MREEAGLVVSISAEKRTLSICHRMHRTGWQLVHLMPTKVRGTENKRDYHDILEEYFATCVLPMAELQPGVDAR